MERNPQIFKALIDNIPSPVFSRDSNGRYLGCNRAFEIYLGRTNDDIIGKTVYDLAPRELAEQYQAKDDELFAHPGTQEYEAQVSYADGSAHDVIFHKTTFNDENGRIAGIVGVILDITNRKQAETELRDNEKKYREIFESLYYIFYQVTLDGTLQIISPSVYDRAGYRPEELIGRNVMEIYADPAERAELVARISQQHTINDYEIKLKTKSGAIRQASLSSRMVFDEGGKPIAIDGIIRDITEQKLAEGALRESEQRFHRLVDELPEYVLVYHGDRIRYVNNAVRSVLGYTLEQLSNQSLLEFIAQRDRAKVISNMSKRSAGQLVEQYEVNILDISGNEHCVLANTGVISYQGEPAVLAVLHDITERKRTEQELLEAKALVEAVVENVPLMIFLKEASDLRFVLFNHAGEELLGYDRSALLGKNNLDLFPPEQAAHFMAKDREVLDGAAGMLDIPEEPILTAKKGQRLLHTQKVCIRGGDGTTKYLLGISEDITEQKRKQLLQDSLYRISELAANATTLDELYAGIHRIIGQLMPADNFFLTILDERTGLMSFPYFVDQYDPHPDPRPMGNGLTERVLRSSTLLLKNPETDKTIGPFESIGHVAISWLGVPLRSQGKTFGAMVVQVYDTVKIFSQREAGILSFVADHVAAAIIRKKNEETLQANEAKFRSIFDSSNDGIIVVGTVTKKFMMVNQTVCRMLGYTSDELTALTVKDIHPPQDLPAVMDAFDKMVRMEIKTAQALPMQRKDGSEFYADISVYPLMMEKEMCLVGVFRDITERLQNEAKLMQYSDTQNAMATLLQFAQKDITIHEVLDKALDIVLSIPWLSLESQGSIFLVEDDPRALVMKSRNKLAGPICAACATIPFGYCLCGRAAQTQQVVFSDCLDERHEVTYAGIIPHGHYCVPVIFDGKTLGVINLYVREDHVRSQMEESFLTTMADALAGIIWRKRAEEDLRVSEQRFQQVSGSTGEWVWEVDPEGLYTYSNEAVEHILGYHPEELTGKKHYADLFAPGMRDQLRQAADEQFAKHVPIMAFVHTELHKNGPEVTLETNGVPFYGPTGEFLGYRGTNKNITMRRALEEERERLIIELQDSLDNLKTLKGLVPICASCKKIRNDGGYWQQVEEYVAEHTEADFSHGLCDECAHKLYPEYFHDKKNKSEGEVIG